MKERCDVRIITIDSCRYDTAKKANTCNLDKIAPLRKAETSGTYTYPAHQSFFIGDFPRIIEGDHQYIRGFDQIWRSASARQTNKPILSLYNAPNIIAHYEHIGYNVQGFGGVGFFSKYDKNNSLPRFFTNFLYFGPVKNTHPYEKIPRNKETLPLGNIGEIVKRLDRNTPYFLFINSPETHIPYDFPNTNCGKDYVELIKRVYIEQNLKKKYQPGELPITPEEVEVLKQVQVRALEWIDYKIGELFRKLPIRRPTLTIVCADHGEEFGDHGRFGHAHFDETVMHVPVWAGYSE